MSLTGLPAFDSTIHTTNVWLKELGEEMGWADRHEAYHALRDVLHALRDRLPVDVAAALGAQLPMLVRGFYYEGWHPGDKPLRERHREEFLQHIGTLPDEPTRQSERAARAVFRILNRHLSPGEVQKVKLCLPGDIRALWA